MARRTTAKKAKKGISLDFSNVSKAFEPKQEYAIRVTEATLEEGTKAPYFNLKLQGVEGSDYENSTMYHRASCSESSLWRLRPLLEAFGFEIPEGPLDIEPEDFIGREAMCSTYLDRYDGGSSVKPDEFWALDGDASDDEEDSEEFDLDELSDDQIEALGAALKVKGKNVSAIKKALAKLDQEDVAAAFAELGGEEDEEGDEEEFDLDELDDDKVLELAKAMKVKASNAKKARAALSKLDQEEVAEVFAELEGEDEEDEEEKPKGKASKGKASKGKAKAVTEDDIQEMSEEELEAVIEQYELDVDLSDHKTLRKMKNAVIDAMEEGDHFAG